MIDIFRKKDYWGINIFIAALGVLVWYFFAKVAQFEKLAYQSDLYTHLEICRGWLQDRPIMHENCYGYHGKLHNYFFDLLMGPFALWWGVYGIFGVQLALYIIALCYTFPVLYKKEETLNHKVLTAVFYIAFFCGPYAFYAYDNPHYGFHTEMLYVPLGLIFAVSLYKKQLWVSVLSSLLMVLVKEDGPVMVACTHLLYLALQYTAKNITQRRWLLQSLLWGGVWILVFLAGIIYLKYQNNFGYDRLSESLERIGLQTAADKKKYFTPIAINFFMLLIPFPILLLFMRVTNYRVWLWFIAFLVPITLVNLVSGFVYFPASFFSLTWVPRFSLTLSLFLAMGAFSLLLFSRPILRPPFAIMVFGILMCYGFFALQIQLLKSEKNYNYKEESRTIFKEQHPCQYMPHYADVARVAAVLPENYPVAPPYTMFGYFHKQDLVWTNVIYNAWKWPRMIICDNSNIENVFADQLLQHPDSIITPKVKYYFEHEDRHYLEQAGIKNNPPYGAD